MFVYKIDSQSYQTANREIRELLAELAEVSRTLQILSKALTDHEAAFSTPTIKEFREQLQQRVTEAEAEARAIVDLTQRLVTVSDQAGKHMLTMEDHFGAALQDKAIA